MRTLDSCCGQAIHAGLAVLDGALGLLLLVGHVILNPADDFLIMGRSLSRLDGEAGIGGGRLGIARDGDELGGRGARDANQGVDGLLPVVLVRLLARRGKLGGLTTHQVALGLALDGFLVHDGLEMRHLPRLPAACWTAHGVPVGDRPCERVLPLPLQPFLENRDPQLEPARGIQVAQARQAEVAADIFEEGVGGLAAHCSILLVVARGACVGSRAGVLSQDRLPT